jgi:mannose-6-phosphate isomerase class I
VFEVAVPDFALSLIDGVASADNGRAGPQILLGTNGSSRVDELVLKPGQAVFVAANHSVTVEGHGSLFRATVGR